MCFEDQWSGIDATNKIVLVKRGVCAVSDKAKLARAHGAIAMILYNQSSGTSISIPTLGSDNYGKLIPIGIVPLEVGTAWKERLQSAPGEDLTVTLVVDAIVEPRETWNVLAETKAGDPNAVIMLGAHLDSVQAGPGINDDASGSVALLEIASALASSVGVASRNKIRLAWWGAEESGLVGSLYYTTTLAPEEADRIRFYFNYDMIGSIVPSYRVYQSNAGDSAGAAPLLLHLQEQGKNASYG